MTLHAEFELPGLASTGEARGLPRVNLRYADEEEIDRRWNRDAAVRLSEERIAGNEPERTVDFEPVVGYRLYARYFGLALVSPDGSEVMCAPPPLSPWRWQRFLMGRVVPLAAMLHGYELLHASAVAVNGRAVALAGASGAGKSSLALRLALSGSTLLTDDVLSLSTRDAEVVVHPGSGVVSLRDTEDELAGEAARAGLGSVLGWAGKAHLAAGVTDQALPLGAFYFLRPGSGPPRIEALEPYDPRWLLASTFVHEVRTPARLRRHLEICSAMADSVPTFVVSRGDAGPAATAVAIGKHAHRRLA